MIEGETIWDLSPLVDNTDQASIQKTMESMVAEALLISEEYSGRVESLDGRGLLELLELKDAARARVNAE